MRSSTLAASAALLAAWLSPADAVSLRANANPIRKVVSLLQSMQKKVEAEGVAEKDLYDKFMCYCKNGKGDLAASIAAAEDSVPALGTNIEETEGKLSQSKEDLKQAQTDRSSAKGAMQEAAALREKEAAAFAAEKGEADTNIAALDKAIAALEKGMAGAFLQSGSARVLKKLAMTTQDFLDDSDRQEILAFLSGTQDSSYAPQSGEITGLLKQLRDTMAKGLAESTAQEAGSKKTHDELMAAKAKETAALSATIESKTQDIGQLGVKAVQLNEDLSDTQAALKSDKEFLQSLESSCSTKAAEWEERSKTRAEELVALADTIKVLNDDDALDLFKKTLPSASSASFAQVSVKATDMRSRALDHLRGASKAAGEHDRAGLDFLMLALAGKKTLGRGGFDKVIKMCDEMVAVLKKEQDDDDHKIEYCGAQFDVADDKKKGLVRTVSQHESAIATAKQSIATLTEEIAALEAGIKKLDKSVAEATEQRKAENAEYKELMASDGAAEELLGFAKNRLNKFYNPKLYKPPAKVELSQQERINVNLGGEADPTSAPGGIAGTGISAFVQISARKGAPEPPPETWGAYAKKGEESTGVIAMIDLLVKDLRKEMTEAESGEKADQANYETMMKESATKRAQDSDSLTVKGSAKADMEAELQTQSGGKKAAGAELMATEKYISSLHGECDWLVKYADVRKQARADEVDSLGKAKAVLSGADYDSFVQTVRNVFHRLA